MTRTLKITEIKSILEACIYLIEQIEICDVEINDKKAALEDYSDMERQKRKFTESLQKTMKQLSWED